jgi:hypothetical protein
MELIDLGAANGYKFADPRNQSGPIAQENSSSMFNQNLPNPTNHLPKFSIIGKTKGFIKNNLRTWGLVAAIIILALGALWGGYTLFQNNQASAVQGASATTNLSQHFQVVARDSTGHPLVPAKLLDLSLIRAEKTNNILIQAKKYNTINGKQFLVIYFNVKNPDKAIYYINTADLFRFRDSSGNKIVPAVHQGTIDIRPISTASSNVGFLINQYDKNFKVEIGEIDGNLKTFEVNF